MATAENKQFDSITRRIWLPAKGIFAHVRQETVDTGLFNQDQPIVRLLPVGDRLLQILLADPSSIYDLSEDQFEELICERLYAMNLEPKRIGPTRRKDGGIDIIFTPRAATFQYLGAVQVKHHRSSTKRQGVADVRNFAGAVDKPFDVGLFVTNATFTRDAEWFAAYRARSLRLRDFQDVCRWIRSDFDPDMERREIPAEIEICPGVFVSTRDLSEPDPDATG